MRGFRALSLTSTIAWLVFTSLFAIGLYAQAPGFTITPLLQSTFGDDASKDAVVLTVELTPGAPRGDHASWRGDGTVVEGIVELHVEGVRHAG